MTFAFVLLLLSCHIEAAPPLATDSLSRPAILQQVNNIRSAGSKCGTAYYPSAPPLVWSQRLELAAQRHADDMYQQDFFSHRGSDRSRVKERVEDTGFAWRQLGENIASGYTSAELAIASWEESPGHCENLMGKDFTHIGVARRGTYWVMVLARKGKE